MPSIFLESGSSLAILLENGGLLLTATGSVSGYDGTVAINAAGKLVNGHGTLIQLRGGNIGLFDSTIYSAQPANQQVWGPYAGPTGPPLPTYTINWKLNCMRITMNATAFLNCTVGNFTSGSTATSVAWNTTTINADPNSVVKPGLLNLIQWARMLGLYMIIECHTSAPKYTFGGTTHFLCAWSQSPFMDYDCTLPFWTAALGAGPGNTDAHGYTSSGLPAWIKTYAVNPATGNTNDIIYELFNEPMLEQQTVNLNTQNLGAGASLTVEQVMATGGWVSGYFNATSANGLIGSFNVGIPAACYGTSGQPNTTTDPYAFNYWWRAAGYQTVVAAMRAAGITNIIQLNPKGFATTFSTIHSWWPTDTMSPPQLSIGWHPYNSGQFPNSLDPEVGTAAILKHPQAFLAGSATYTIGANNYTGIGHAVPIVADETATAGAGGTGQPTPDPYIHSMVQWADGGTDTTTGTPFTGTFSLLPWNLLETIGTGNPTYDFLNQGSTFTITGSISTALPIGYPPGTGTLTVTATSTTINPGMVVSSGATTNGGWVGAQLSGTTGGIGTYAFSIGQTVASTILTCKYWVTLSGQGQTFIDNWTVGHAP